MRNRIVHGYWDIDIETLVTTAIDDIPQMVLHIDDVIATLEPDDGR